MWDSEILWRVLQGWMQVQKLISFILSCHVYLWWAQQLKTWQRKLSSIRIQGKVRQGIWKRRLWLVSAAAITAMHHHLRDDNFVSNFLWIQKHWGKSLQMLRILYLNSEESSTFLVNGCFNIPDISMLEHWDILVEGFAVPDIETIPYTVIRQEQDFEIREVKVRKKLSIFLQVQSMVDDSNFTVSISISIVILWFQFQTFCDCWVLEETVICGCRDSDARAKWIWLCRLRSGLQHSCSLPLRQGNCLSYLFMSCAV